LYLVYVLVLCSCGPRENWNLTQMIPSIRKVASWRRRINLSEVIYALAYRFLYCLYNSNTFYIYLVQWTTNQFIWYESKIKLVMLRKIGQILWSVHTSLLSRMFFLVIHGKWQGILLMIYPTQVQDTVLSVIIKIINFTIANHSLPLS